MTYKGKKIARKGAKIDKQLYASLFQLDDDEKGVSSIDTPGGEQEMLIVNEPGLYGLILASLLPLKHLVERG